MNQFRDCENNSDTLFISFNQNSTSLAIGSKTGFRIYSFDSPEKLRVAYEDCQVRSDVFIVERLFSASMAAFVSLNSPRKLLIYHLKRRQEIQSLSYSNAILSVRMNRQRLLVCLEDSIYVHSIKDFSVLHVIKDTPPNPRGLISLAPSCENCLVAYPSSSTVGEVAIFDLQSFQNKILIPAHDNPLAALAFDSNGVRLASASEKGTVIRVFQVQDGQILYEFRRGYARCVSIFSLNFSADSTFLAASSNTQTVHIFKLEDPEAIRIAQEEQQGWMGYFNKALASSANYLPGQISDVMKQWRSFAQAKLPTMAQGHVVAMANFQGENYVLVASSDGYVYVYSLDAVNGADCALIKQHRLDQLQYDPSSTDNQFGTRLEANTRNFDKEFPSFN